MKVIKDAQELVSCFRDFEQDKVFLPKDMKFPVVIEDYYTWVDPSGHRSYLLATLPQSSPVGIVFRRPSPSPQASPKMCDWCNKVLPGDQVGLLSAHRGKDISVGKYLCRDLNCKERLQETPGLHDLRETVNDQTKLDRLVHRVRSFIRRNIT